MEQIPLMIKSLFGTKTTEMILFYLLQNKKCYSSELKQVFGMHYTRLRSALIKLEMTGALIGYNEGKTHLYRFNPKCSFIKELKTLLKKLYQNLPQKTREKYYEGKRTWIEKNDN